MNKATFKRVLLAALLATSTGAFAQLGKLIDKAKTVTQSSPGATNLNQTDIATALKQALELGATKSADMLSAQNGFFGDHAVKILFPPEALKAEATLRKLGLDKICDDAILSFNRAAEDAAKTAKPIFVNAIKKMTIKDATDILMGNNNAATNYFKTATTDSLIKVFNPIVEKSMEKVGATRYYADVVKRYNRVPFVTKLNPDIKRHITEMAIDGLFKKIAVEELRIRENSIFRTTDLMKKVFAQADEK